MAEIAVLFVLQQFVKLAVKDIYKHTVKEVKSLRDVDKGFEEIKHELESIQAFLKDADTRAAHDKEGRSNGVKTWVKQLREISFRIEDVIDEYVKYLARKVKNSGSTPLTKTIKKHDIASEIQHIKSSLVEIKERREKYNYNFKKEDGSSGSSRGATQNENFGDPRMASLFIQETQVVGFEKPRDDLVPFLVEETNELKLVSLVGMGGLGKTTLAKIVFDNESVKKHFDCRAFITVSETYNVRELLTEMIKKFCKDSNERIPKGLQKMDKETLITQVAKYLELKRYLVLFDDVWTEKFSDEINHPLISNKQGSRIIVTTRKKKVAKSFKKYFHDVVVHELQPLPPNKAQELFCNKVFRGQCPTELEKMSNEIVQKCGGLPLAIVAIGGLLSTKEKTMFEWRKLSQNLRMELERNVHLTDLMKILSLSYEDLPYHLKSCMLYFGIYPEDYTINRKRITRQWMAEGFIIINNKEKRPLEEVAEEYLTELIQRSLVNVSTTGFDGKVKSCQVHDVLREVIITKMKDLCFCHLIHKDDEQLAVEKTRRFSIAAVSNNDLRNTGDKGIRAIFIFDKGELPKDFMDGLSKEFKLLRVLDFENSLLNSIPDNLGNLFHLRYLNLSHTKVTVLPKSIGMLVNLETLDLRQTKVHKLPKEIEKLTKLRLLPVYYRKYEGQYSMLSFTDGLKMQEGIGSLTSLQKLYFLEAPDLEAADLGGVDLIRELEKLTQLRKLGIKRVEQGHANALCGAIQKMKNLESLNIGAKDKDETFDLDFLSTPPPNLRILNLKGKLTNFPNWIPNLNCLVKLRLGLSNFEHDPLDSLKSLPNLLRLNLWDDAFASYSLHFQVGGFPKLKEIDLTRLNKLSSITIEKGALLGLEHFRFKKNPQLKVLPQDLQNLKNLQFLGFAEMPAELVDSIAIGGPCHGIINHIPLVQIRENFGPKFHEYTLRRIPTQIKYLKHQDSNSPCCSSQEDAQNSINCQFILAFLFCFLSFVVWMLFYK